MTAEEKEKMKIEFQHFMLTNCDDELRSVLHHSCLYANKALINMLLEKALEISNNKHLQHYHSVTCETDLELNEYMVS
jgi:hypothetical protein